MKRAGVDTRSALKKQLSAQAAMQAELEAEKLAQRTAAAAGHRERRGGLCKKSALVRSHTGSIPRESPKS